MDVPPKQFSLLTQKEQHTDGADMLETSTPDIILDEQIADDDGRPRKNRRLVQIYAVFQV